MTKNMWIVLISTIVLFVFGGHVARWWSIPGRDPCIAMVEQCKEITAIEFMSTKRGKACASLRMAMVFAADRVKRDRCQTLLRRYNMWGW